MSRLAKVVVQLVVVAVVMGVVSGQAFADDHDVERAQLEEQWEERYERADRERTDYTFRTRFGQKSDRSAISPYRHIRDRRGYFHFAPHLGMPGLYGDVTSGDQAAGLDAGPMNTLQNIDLTAGAAFEVGYRHVGLLADFRHFNGAVDDFELQKFISNVAVGWNYGILPILQLGPVAGVRHVWAQAGVDDEQNNDAGLVTDDWLDPIVGISGEFTFADIVYVPFYADVGGIGYGSEITWQGYGGVGVSLDRTDIELGFRALYADFQGEQIEYDLLQAGPTLRTRFRF